MLLREGVTRVLLGAGFDIVAQAGDATRLLAMTLAFRPDVVIVDVRMPPHHGDDGLRTAIEVRKRLPLTAVVLLTQYCEPEFAIDLIGDRPQGVGYLLKERVGDVDDFVAAVKRVACGGSALDPEVVTRMLRPSSVPSELADLTDREHSVLARMAEGLSNRGIARALLISEAAVEKHVTAMFRKLGLDQQNDGHRRVQAVLLYLAAQGP